MIESSCYLLSSEDWGQRYAGGLKSWQQTWVALTPMWQPQVTTLIQYTKVQPLNSGVYSQRIFEYLGHNVINRVKYEDFKDENGNLYLNDTREHTSIITCYRKLI